MFFNKYVRRCAVLFVSSLLVACGGGGGGEGRNAGAGNSGNSGYTGYGGYTGSGNGNGGGGASPTAEHTISGPVVKGNNVMAVVVNHGLTGIKNRLYASVKVCHPITNNCTTIDNILVDTGSFGLRLMQSPELSAINLDLETVGGETLMNCVQFLDTSNLWGSVSKANIQLGGLTTSIPIPIQIAANPATPYALPSACGNASNSMTAANSINNTLGANGILGIGTAVSDCGAYCANTSGIGAYYTCPNGTCSATTVPLDNQLQNPVPHFPTDNNGLIVMLPNVPLSGATTVNGSIIFGVGTHANNQLDGTSTLIQPGNRNGGGINTSVSAASASYGPVVMTNSFFDTGSNGLLFGTPATPAMPIRTKWYAPAAPVTLTATISGKNTVDKTISMVISDTGNFSYQTYARPSMGTTVNDSQIFDWGLPFYYGRKVYLVINDMTADAAGQPITGPYFAF